MYICWGYYLEQQSYLQIQERSFQRHAPHHTLLCEVQQELFRPLLWCDRHTSDYRSDDVQSVLLQDPTKYYAYLSTDRLHAAKIRIKDKWGKRQRIGWRGTTLGNLCLVLAWRDSCLERYGRLWHADKKQIGVRKLYEQVNQLDRNQPKNFQMAIEVAGKADGLGLADKRYQWTTVVWKSVTQQKTLWLLI